MVIDELLSGIFFRKSEIKGLGTRLLFLDYHYDNVLDFLVPRRFCAVCLFSSREKPRGNVIYFLSKVCSANSFNTH